MHEAPAGRAVMAGAEGEPGLDLDRDVIRLDPRPVVAPMNEKAPGPNRFKAGQRIGDPVLLFREAKGRRAGGRIVRSGGDQRPERRLVRRFSEIGLHEPGPAAARPEIIGLERGRGGLGRLEALEDEVGDGAGAALVADEPQHVGGVVRRQAFEHGRPIAQTNSNSEMLRGASERGRWELISFICFSYLDFSAGYGRIQSRNKGRASEAAPRQTSRQPSASSAKSPLQAPAVRT